MDHVNESILNDEIKEHLKQNRTNHMQYLPDMEVIDSDILDKVVADMQSYDYDSRLPSAPRRKHASTSATPSTCSRRFTLPTTVKTTAFTAASTATTK